MSLSIAAYRQAGDQIEDVDVDINANIQISKLATRTLILTMPANTAQKNGSGCADSSQGVYGSVTMPDANSSDLYFSTQLPDEWSSGNIVLRIWWLTSATANNAKFSASIKSTTSGGSVSSEETQTVTTAANGSANTVNSSSVTFAAADFTAGDFIGIIVSRNPADAADTLATDLKVLAVSLEYTGRG